MRLFAVALLGLGCALVAARPMDVQTVLRADNDMLSANIALASPVEAFDLWLQRYNKDYVNDPREKATRLGVFKSNAATIAAHNANPASTFVMALNEFADLTFQEFAATRLGFNLSLADGLLSNGNANAATPFRYEDVDVADLPKSIDWRERGAVTPVKNQGMCGSCWAFSATGAIEGINAIQTGKLVSLSEQQLVSCDTAKDMGCGGGLMDYAFEYVVKNGGIDTEEDYGYWSWGLPCQHRREHDRPAVTIESYEDVPPADADSLKKALAHQPVSVAICANSNLQFYSSGVVKEKSCCQELNHGVLAVGYDDGEGSWLVKNSWGASWGEKGFFRVAREASNPNGVCGILQAASYPVKESTTNPEVPEICGFFGFTECPLRQSCQCNWSFFGLFCLNWGCVKPHSAEL